MKKIFNIKAALGLVLTAAMFSSCLKDTQRQPNFTNDVPVVDFPTVVVSGSAQSVTLSSAVTTNSLNALISIGATHDYTTATTVTLIVDQTALPSGGTLLPSSVYTVSSLSTNINPGIQQRIENVQPVVGTPLALPSASEGLISFVINTSQYQALIAANPTATYYLPLTISSASGNGAVIDQWHTLVYKLSIK